MQIAIRVVNESNSPLQMGGGHLGLRQVGERRYLCVVEFNLAKFKLHTMRGDIMMDVARLTLTEPRSKVNVDFSDGVRELANLIILAFFISANFKARFSRSTKT